jgi:hypothetical protein
MQLQRVCHDTLPWLISFSLDVKLLSVSVVMAVASAAALQAEKPSDSPFPQSFKSREAAAKYARGLFASGDVDVLRVADTNILILYVYGSGVPDIGIAAYRFSEGRWRLAKQFAPPTIEFHKAIVSGKQVVVVGRETKQRWTLLKLD